MAVIDYSDWDSVNKVEYYKRQEQLAPTPAVENNKQQPAAPPKDAAEKPVQNPPPKDNEAKSNQSDIASTVVVAPTESKSVAQATATLDQPKKTKSTSKPSKTTSTIKATSTSKIDSKDNKIEDKKSGGSSTKTIGYIVGGVVALIIFLLIVKIYRRTKINKYRNRKKTIRKNDTTREGPISKVPTISYGNATSIY